MSLILALIALTVTGISIVATSGALNTFFRASSSLAVKSELQAVRQSLISTIDCEKTIENPGVCPSGFGGFIQLRDKNGNTIAPLLTADFDGPFKGSGPLYNGWHVQTTCDSNFRTLVVKVARKGPEGNFSKDPLSHLEQSFQSPRGGVFDQNLRICTSRLTPEGAVPIETCPPESPYVAAIDFGTRKIASCSSAPPAVQPPPAENGSSECDADQFAVGFNVRGNLPQCRKVSLHSKVTWISQTLQRTTWRGSEWEQKCSSALQPPGWLDSTTVWIDGAWKRYDELVEGFPAHKNPKVKLQPVHYRGYAVCPTGSVPVGGGGSCQINGGGVTLESRPGGTADGSHGWFLDCCATYAETLQDSPTQVEVYCIDVR